MDLPTLLGMSWTALAMMLAAIAVLALIFHLYVITTLRNPMQKRVRALVARREQLKAGIIATQTKRRAKLQNQNKNTDMVRTVLSSLSVLQDSQIKQAQIMLMQSGIRNRDSAVLVILGRLLLPIAFGGAMLIFIYVLDGFPTWTPLKRYMLAAATLVGSYKAPDIYLGNLISKRTAAIRKGLPDALDLLVICAEAGLTVDAAFSRVAKELTKPYPELGDEFTLTSIELGFLTDRRTAFENLAMRVKLDGVKGVVTTMIQTEKYGTPLASALRVLSAEFRNERMMRAEEKAARLPAIMTVPLILFILPVLFVVILGPAACSISDTLMK
jgi:tight adherence protein C